MKGTFLKKYSLSFGRITRKYLNQLSFMRYTWILFLLPFFFISCSSDNERIEIDFFANDTIPLRLKMHKALGEEHLNKLGFTEEQKTWIKYFYRSRDYKTSWINDSVINSHGIMALDVLKRSPAYGVPFKRVELPMDTSSLWIDRELVITTKLAYMLYDMNHSFIDRETKKLKPKKMTGLKKYIGFLDRIGKENADSVLLSQGPADSNYRFIINNIHNFCSSYNLDTTHYDITSIKKDSLNTFPKTKAALMSKGYLLKNTDDSLEIVSALKVFQRHNGLAVDGVIGGNTSKALNESNYDKVLRAILALDAMKTPKALPDKYIMINIPEYLLRFFVNDSLKRTHRIVVGTPENKTPVLTSKIRNIVVYPYWNVPYSIASKEILPALKRNAGYASSNNYKIYRGDTEINPYSVNWSRIRENSFPYRVVQSPGPKNSLGILKFEFYNSYSVYVHDTPAKSLFSTSVRSYSHGCMRSQDPVGLGKTILDYDSVGRKRNDLTADSLDSLLMLKKHYSIRLKDPVPIYVEYRTVSADRNSITFYLDIYRKEEELIGLMK